MRRGSRGFVVLFVGLSGTVDTAFGGGFDRFGQDVSLLFDPAKTVIDVKGAYIMPWSNYDTINGAREKVPIVGEFPLATFGLKWTLQRDVACLGTAAETFGTTIDPGTSWSHAKVLTEQSLSVRETGVTCSLRAPAGEGFVRAIAGVTYDWAEFQHKSQSVDTSGRPVVSRLTFEGESESWRVGFAYEQPDLATLISVMYYGPIGFDLEGRIVNLPLGGGAFIRSVPIEGAATMPEAVEFNVRSAIAPGWFAGASLKWMDWSSFDHVPFRTRSATGPFSTGTEIVDFKTYFRDGWTIGGFVARVLDAQWTIGLRALWDRGVTTGWTEHTDSWLLYAGFRYRLSYAWELSVGTNLVLLKGGELDKRAEGAPFDATFDDGYALAPQIGLTWRN